MDSQEPWSGRFLDFIEEQIRLKGALSLLGVPVLIIGIITGLGFVLPWQAMVTVLTAGSLATILVVFIAINHHRKQLALELREAEKINKLYGDRLTAEVDEHRYEIVSWTETMTISSSGDGTMRRWITIKVGQLPLEAFWSVQTSHSPKRSKKVTFTACASDQSRSIGIEYQTSLIWLSENACKAYVHLHSVLPAGSVAHFYMEWTWKNHFYNVVSGVVEPFQWKVKRPIGTLEVTLNVPPLRAYRTMGVDRYGAVAAPTVTRSADGAHAVEFTAANLSGTGELIGFSAQMKR